MYTLKLQRITYFGCGEIKHSKTHMMLWKWPLNEALIKNLVQFIRYIDMHIYRNSLYTKLLLFKNIKNLHSIFYKL